MKRCSFSNVRKHSSITNIISILESLNVPIKGFNKSFVFLLFSIPFIWIDSHLDVVLESTTLFRKYHVSLIDRFKFGVIVHVVGSSRLFAFKRFLIVLIMFLLFLFKLISLILGENILIHIGFEEKVISYGSCLLAFFFFS